jgi:hypothetical protein
MPLEMGNGDQKDPKQAAHKHFRDMTANQSQGGQQWQLK